MSLKWEWCGCGCGALVCEVNYQEFTHVPLLASQQWALWDGHGKDRKSVV